MKNFLLRSIGVTDIQTGQTASLSACLDMAVQRSDLLLQGVLDGLLSGSAQGCLQEGPLPVLKSRSRQLHFW